MYNALVCEENFSIDVSRGVVGLLEVLQCHVLLRMCRNSLAGVAVSQWFIVTTLAGWVVGLFSVCFETNPKQDFYFLEWPCNRIPSYQVEPHFRPSSHHSVLPFKKQRSFKFKRLLPAGRRLRLENRMPTNCQGSTNCQSSLCWSSSNHSWLLLTPRQSLLGVPSFFAHALLSELSALLLLHSLALLFWHLVGWLPDYRVLKSCSMGCNKAIRHFDHNSVSGR